MRLSLILFLIALKKYHQCILEIQIFSLYLKILQILYKEGFIQHFYVNKKLLNVILYNKKELFKSYKTISTSAHSVFLTTRNIYKHYEKGYTLFISTSTGVFTLLDCKKKNQGGLLLFQI